MMWFNKNHPNVAYMDIRYEDITSSRGEILHIHPDYGGDFRHTEFNHKFKLIVWDPPHLVGNCITGDLAKSFGSLKPETWQNDLKHGFANLWKHLEDYGVLIFKWNEACKKVKQILCLFPEAPLFGQISKGGANCDKCSKTYWFCFMKLPEAEK